MTVICGVISIFGWSPSTDKICWLELKVKSKKSRTSEDRKKNEEIYEDRSWAELEVKKIKQD